MMFGYIVVIARNGSVGGRYPLTNSDCLFGQSATCDVRVYVQNVARKHCVISVLPNKQVVIRNLSPTNTTLVNGTPIRANQCQLEHGDLITVGDRHFRWEYPISSRPGNTPKADQGNQRSPACMVQVPLSAFRNKRHSTSGVVKGKEITPLSIQDGGESNSKRRKTVGNITDLAVENTLAKPVNKRLLALTQPASSPKSFNTFRVLLKSASKRKSLIPVSKTPKSAKKVISSKHKRSKSTSFLENKRKSSLKNKSLSPKDMSTKTSQENKAHSSRKSLTPFKNKSPKKTQKHSKSPSSKKSLTPFKIKALQKTPKQSETDLNKSLSPVNRVTPKKTPRSNKTPLKKKSSLATPLKNKTPESSKIPQRKNLSTSKISKSASLRTKKNTLDKTPRGRKTISGYSVTPPKKTSPLNKTSVKKLKGSARKSAEVKSSSTSTGRDDTTCSPKTQTKDPSSKKSPSLKTPLGRPPLSLANTPARVSFSSRNSSPIKSETPAKTRGKSSNSLSSAKSPSSKTSQNNSSLTIKAPVKTARENSPKSETIASSSSRKSRSPVQSSSVTITNVSPIKEQTPKKTRGRRLKSISPSNPPETSVNSSLAMTSAKKQIGGSPKTEPKVSMRRSRSSVQLPLNTSQNSSTTIEQTPKKTRGRPPKSISPSNLPETSINSSLTMTSAKKQIGSSPKTEPKVSMRRSRSSVQLSLNTSQNSSTTMEQIPKKTRGRPSKSLSLRKSSTFTSPSPKMNSPRRKSLRSSESAKKLFSLDISPPPKTSRISSPVKSPAKGGSKPPEVDLSKATSSQKTPYTNSPMNETFTKTFERKSPDVKESSSAKPQSPVTPLITSPVKTTRGRPATLQAVDVKENLENSSLPPERSPSPKTSFNTSPSNPTVVLPSTTQKFEVLHNRTSIMRHSLHHDLSLLISESEDTTNNDGMETDTRKSVLRRLSLSRSSGISITKPMLLKSSSKVADSSKHKSSSKRKQENDFEARAERAAKRLKMETPKSLSKNKVAALLVCHGRSPKSVQKRRLFSEVLKSHLSAAKRRQPVPTTSTTSVGRKNMKLKPFEPALEVPKSFKFNSTGHANSPETIVITKKIRKTPGPKTRKGRKSGSIVRKEAAEQDLEGVSQLFKTPSRAIVSSLKSASSVKKPQSVRVRFSLQNDVQSPSGKRSLAPHTESVGYFGSPIIQPKQYVRTPLPSRFNESALLHTSIMEESPRLSSTGSAKRKSSLGVANQSFDFSAYSPSSPTLQFSQMSGVSPVTARKSIDFSDFSPLSESDESPKRKRSMPVLDSSLSQSSTRKISFAGSKVSKSQLGNKDSSPDENARLTESYLFGSAVGDSDVSLLSRASRRLQNDSGNSSNLFRFSPSGSQRSSRSSRSASQLNVSQIPLPPSTSKSKLSEIFTVATPGSSKANDSLRLRRTTRSSSNISFPIETPKTTVSRPNSETFTLKESKIVLSPKTSPSSVRNRTRSFQSNFENDILVVYDGSQTAKQISSTPKFPPTSNNYSPHASPISNQQSNVSESFMDDKSSFVLASLSKTASPIFSDSQFKTPLPTTGKKSRKSSMRMSASNSVLHTSESQVPVAAVKPSTRKRPVSESPFSDTDSISLPNLSGSQNISGRSMDRNFAQRMLESRASSGFDQQTSREGTSSSSGDQPSISPGSGRRKRKSSAFANSQFLDVTDFDFNSAVTPKVPREIFVSPLAKVEDDQTDLLGLKRVLNLKGNSPVSSYLDVKGVKRLLKSPKQGTPVANYTGVEGLKDLFKHSPVADYTNVVGVKRLYGAPSEPNYMNVKGVRRIFKDAKTPNSPDVTGVEVLFESPKKIVEEYNQPSTSRRPVVMVSPMSRSNTSSKPSRKSDADLEELVFETLEVAPTQNLSRTNEMSRQTRNMTLQEGNENAEDNIPAGDLRQNRSFISNQEVVSNKKEESESLVSKPRGRRKVQKDIEKPVDENTQHQRRGRSNRREIQIDSQTKVRPVEECATVIVGEENTGVSEIRKGRAGKKGKVENQETSVKIDEQPPKELVKRRTRAKKEELKKETESVEQTAVKSFEQKKTGGRQKADNLAKVNQSPDRPKSRRGLPVDDFSVAKPLQKGETSAPKTRGKSRSSNDTPLGKRKLVKDSVDNEIVNHSPPKRGRKVKLQNEVPQDAPSSSGYVKQTILEGSSGKSRKASTVSDTDDMQPEVQVEDQPTTSLRLTRNKSKKIPKSQDKEEKVSSPQPVVRSRRVQANNAPETVVNSTGNNVIKSPPKSSIRSQKNQVGKQKGPLIPDEVKPTSHLKKDESNEAVSESQLPTRSRRLRRDKSVEGIETTIQTTRQEAKESKEEIVGGNAKSVNPKTTTSRTRTKRGETEELQGSPQENNKKKGKGKKNGPKLTENDNTAKLDQRLKENTTPEEPTTSRRESRNKPENPVAAKTSKRVQFNTVTPQTPKEDKPKRKATKVVAVKANVGSKRKPAATRKSTSPVKSPVAKRVTRSRK